MGRAALLLICILSLPCHSQDSAEAIDFDTLTKEKLENLPPELIAELPAIPLMRRFLAEENKAGFAQIVEYGILFSLRGLLYTPVDTTEYGLEDAVAAFQLDISAEPTGVLTFSQFFTLMSRFHRRHDTPIYASGTASVYQYEDFLLASGTWIIEKDQIAYPVNTSEIRCDRSQGTCLVIQADVIVPALDSEDDSYSLSLNTNSYNIISWSDSEVIAQSTGLPGSCRTAMLTINSKTKEVYEIARNATAESCEVLGVDLGKLEHPQVSRLVDGFQTTYEYWKTRNKQTLEFLSAEHRERLKGLMAPQTE